MLPWRLKGRQAVVVVKEWKSGVEQCGGAGDSELMSNPAPSGAGQCFFIAFYSDLVHLLYQSVGLWHIRTLCIMKMI
jgi:hypothetical protein